MSEVKSLPPGQKGSNLATRREIKIKRTVQRIWCIFKKMDLAVYTLLLERSFPLSAVCSFEAGWNLELEFLGSPEV